MSRSADTGDDGWTPEQRARLRTFHDSGNPSDLTASHIRAGNGGRTVAPDACERWRRRLRADATIDATDIDSEDWTTSSIRSHAYGKCSHDADAVGPPAESAFRNGGARE